jgi:hypothetical protein
MIDALIGILDGLAGVGMVAGMMRVIYLGVQPIEVRREWWRKTWGI